MIQITPQIAIEESEIREEFIHSSGPGGQNVNKVASKIELHVDLVKIVGLDYAARNRLWTACANRLDAEGHLLVVSQKTRDQPRNLADARERVREIVAAALERPRPRKPTRPTRGSIDRRIRAKKRLSGLKASRRDRGDDD